jgi:hypothetical protein
MVVGLCLSLFVRRRRVWVRVLPAEPGPAGEGDAPRRYRGGDGRARPHRHEAFADDFRALSRATSGEDG